MEISELTEIGEDELPNDGTNFVALWEYNDLVWVHTYRINGDYWEAMGAEGVWVDDSGEWGDLDISYYIKPTT